MYYIPCHNCNGKKVIEKYKHIENGICFTCSGSGVKQVTQQEYNEYKAEVEARKKATYILFNNGSIEYYNNKKDIHNKYGNFYCNVYGGYSILQSYNDQNIIYIQHTARSEDFINAVTTEYKQRNKKAIEKKIQRYEDFIKDEDDKESIHDLQIKLNKLKLQLKEVN